MSANLDPLYYVMNEKINDPVFNEINNYLNDVNELNEINDSGFSQKKYEKVWDIYNKKYKFYPIKSNIEAKPSKRGRPKKNPANPSNPSNPVDELVDRFVVNPVKLPHEVELIDPDVFKLRPKTPEIDYSDDNLDDVELTPEEETKLKEKMGIKS